MDRHQLFRTLSELIPAQFEELIFTIKPPAGIISSRPAPQVTRVADLLTWAESPGGCGLAKVAELLNKILFPSFKSPHVESGDMGLNLARCFITDLGDSLKSGQLSNNFNPLSHEGFSFIGVRKSSWEFNAIALVVVDGLSEEQIVHFHQLFQRVILNIDFSFKRQGILCYVSSKKLAKRDIVFIQQQKKDLDALVTVSWAIDLETRRIDIHQNPVNFVPPVIILPSMLYPNLGELQRFLDGWSPPKFMSVKPG